MSVHTDLSIVAISAAPSPATSGTSLGVTDANAVYLPNIYPWWALVKPSGAKPTRANSEILKVTAGSSAAGTTTYTITRAQGLPVTTARTIIVGDDILEVLTAQQQTDVETASRDGWNIVNETWTYSSVDGPTGVITIPTDGTTRYSVGMRVRFTQTTVKYGIITAISATTATVYMGTDYTLANAAISAISYSSQKAPFGFPLSPAKWTVEVTDTTQRSQASPGAGTWYNLGTITISFPIGLWNIDYVGFIQLNKTASVNDLFITLSTANNTESDTDLTYRLTIYGDFTGNTGAKKKLLSVASKTSYYLNEKTDQSSGSSLYLRSDLVKTVVSAVCAYL